MVHGHIGNFGFSAYVAVGNGRWTCAESVQWWSNRNGSRNKVVNEEAATKEVVQKATMAFSFAEARLQVTVESVDAIKDRNACFDGSLGTESVNESEEEAVNLLMWSSGCLWTA
ncbi:hypothetical protein Droror1_Dr00002292 [Drosera rotundifolia]